jgi:cellulose synthase/poly-beta-1,6-N-acetylglucosamine synthase-like glycosyltransferase
MPAARHERHKGIATRRAQAVNDTWAEEETPVSLAACETVSEKARAYERWLAGESLRAKMVAMQGSLSPVSLEGYARRAGEEISAGERRFRPFAPYQPAYSALRTFTRGQVIALGALALGLIGALALWGAQTVVALLGALTAFYLFDLALTATISTRTLRRNPTVVIDDGVARAVRDGFWPSYTILCPLYHEADVAEQFARAMRLIDYPTDRLQVLFLTEEDDVETREALLKMRLPRHFEVVTVPDGAPRTKPRACNYGLTRATGDFVVIFDAEDIPDPLQLKKAALTFAHHGPELACVQACLNFYNPRQNALTRWFTAEYSLWFDLTLPALRRTRSFLPLGGTSNHFRTRILREVGGWDPFNVTEDCDLGVRLAQYRYQTAMVDSTTYEEANPDLKNWLRQRSRWIKGYMQTYLTHMRDPRRYAREGRLSELFWLQVIVGGRTLTQLVNPLLWLMTLAYVVFHQALTAPYHLLFPAPLFYPAVFCLVFGNLFYIYMYVIGCLNREQYTLTFWALLVPVYWLLMSVAAYIALYQLLTRPHYWEKTRHGLSLLTPSPGWMEAILPLGDLVPILEIARALGNDLINLAELAESVLTQALEGNVQMPNLVANFVRGPLAGMIVYLNDELAHARRDARMNGAREARVAPSLALPVAPVVDMLSTMAMPALAPAIAPTLITHPSLVAIPAIRLSAPAREIIPAPKASKAGAPQAKTMQDAKAPTSRGLAGTWRVALPAWLAWLRDGWLVATLLTAITASIAACVYFFSQHDLLLYNDSESHMRLARLVFDSATPGLAQLGSNWLPLPHILMWPFVWSDFLWRTGLAGTLVAAPCYVVAAVYTFLCARELTSNGAASYAGALALILNPNILYLQTTPLSEATLLAVTAATSYYFLRWARGGATSALLAAAVCALLGVMTRYEGWSLFMALTLMIAVVDLVKRQSMRRMIGDIAVFALPGASGIVLWLIWDYLLTGNPRYFQNGPYSPVAQQTLLREAGQLPTYHHLWLDIVVYSADLLEYFGPAIMALGVAGLIVFFVASWRKPIGAASLALLAPVALYLVSLYSGQTVIYTPGVMPANIHDPIFNVRYATSAAIPLAIFLAHLVRRWPWTRIALVAIILAQTAATATGGVISLQDGQSGVSCLGLHPVDMFLLEHYNGLPIMMDTFSGPHNLATLGIDSREVIYEGSYRLWTAAATDPAAYTDWLVITPNDTVAKAVDTNSPSFKEHFWLVASFSNGQRIYYNKSAPVIPARPVPASLLAEHAQCPGTVSPTKPVHQPSATPSLPPQQESPHASIISPEWTAALSAPFRPAISILEGANA